VPPGEAPLGPHTAVFCAQLTEALNAPELACVAKHVFWVVPKQKTLEPLGQLSSAAQKPLADGPNCPVTWDGVRAADEKDVEAREAPGDPAGPQRTENESAVVPLAQAPSSFAGGTVAVPASEAVPASDEAVPASEVDEAPGSG
jgi:hypothetical protein